MLQNSKALSSLAQYNDSDASEYSDSDADESPPKPQYRDAKSSSSSSSSDSSDEDMAVALKDIKKKIEEKGFDNDDGDSDGEEGGATNRKKKEPLKVKGELGLVCFIFHFVPKFHFPLCSIGGPPTHSRPSNSSRRKGMP